MCVSGISKVALMLCVCSVYRAARRRQCGGSVASRVLSVTFVLRSVQRLVTGRLPPSRVEPGPVQLYPSPTAHVRRQASINLHQGKLTLNVG